MDVSCTDVRSTSALLLNVTCSTNGPGRWRRAARRAHETFISRTLLIHLLLLGNKYWLGRLYCDIFVINLLITSRVDILNLNVVVFVADDKWKSGVVFLSAEVFTGSVKRDGGVDKGRNEKKPVMISQDIVLNSEDTYIPSSSIAKLPFAIIHPVDTP